VSPTLRRGDDRLAFEYRYHFVGKEFESPVVVLSSEHLVYPGREDTLESVESATGAPGNPFDD
jgi:hypothetical protein